MGAGSALWQALTAQHGLTLVFARLPPDRRLRDRHWLTSTRVSSLLLRNTVAIGSGNASGRPIPACPIQNRLDQRGRQLLDRRHSTTAGEKSPDEICHVGAPARASSSSTSSATITAACAAASASGALVWYSHAAERGRGIGLYGG